MRGLRGQPPFDGSRLPRLPWGGPRVDDEEIRFIARWIDDGCPADERERPGNAALEARVKAERLAPVVVDERLAAELTRAAGAAPAGAAGGSAYGHGEVRQRMNLDCLNDDQLALLRAAFRELYALNKWPRDRRSYNNLALIHQDHCQHGWERFLPWHRAYLYEFEQAMQDVCPGATMPYWDWTMPMYRPERPYEGDIIPRSFKAYLTQAGLDEAAAKDRVVARNAEELRLRFVKTGRLFTSLSTFFTAAKEVDAALVEEPHSHRLIDALLAGNPLWYPLRFPAEYQDSKGNPQTINQAIQYHYPTARDMEEILRLRTFRDFGGGSLYNDSFGFLDQNPHNTMHIWTGGMNPYYVPPEKEAAARLKDDSYRERNRSVSVAGRSFHTRREFYAYRGVQYGDMFSNLTASYDPVFWPIHANVDRLWWEWQQRNPHAVPADLTAVLTPWGYTTADVLDVTRFGYEYVRCAFTVPVGMEAPVGRYTSKPIALPEGVRAGFRTAEVRLHRVPQLPRSCFVRVFLNLPDADAHTPLDTPNFGGYLAVFGHGACYGGPGHCDLPPAQGRPFDLRPRSHNTPRNHRIDVTRAARALVEAGATSIQVTLVTIGVDYAEEPELLRMDGLSLNFLD